MEVVQHAESWLAKHPTGSRFVWVHLFDPHDPYEPPPPYSEKYKNLYDGEIAYADSALENLITYLKKTGVYSNAIIVVVGDHGEGLGEHGEETHGLFLYDSTLHVPMILKLAGTGQHGVVVDAQVRTTDILPTILSLIKLSAPAALNGESIMPLIQKQATSHDLLAETDYPLRFGWAPLKAVRAGNVKLIEAPRPELYDLKSDPGELKSLYSADSAQAKTMQAELAKWKAKAGVDEAAKFSAALPDPKDKIEVQNLLHRSMLASDDNRSAEARGFLEKALQLDPASPTALRQLGENELAAGDFAKAAIHLKKAREVRPEDSTAAFELGQALEKSGDFAGARDALEASLKMVPSQMPARLLLGRVYLGLKDPKNAQDQFEAASLVDSNNVDARVGLAEAQILQSDFAGAVPDLEALTKSDPANARALRLLARGYRGLGREPDAQTAEAKAAAAEKK
jgi:choline-sulfatase